MYSFHFDAAIAQISLALSTGATLCFGTRSKLGNGPAILDFMQNHHIHHAAFTLSLLADIPPSLLPSLRSIECGGERCSRALTSWASGRNFYNVYGPTETAIGATYAKCYADDTGEVPIGFPFTNVWIGIIDDEKLHPVQHGEVGEIVIGGLGVSPGYLNRPELTSQQFITIEGETCYRTGDLGVVIDNNLWYRGRKEGDLEVKLAGGRRFNLGEIEAKLLELPSILLCAAGLWDRRLLVYLMGHADVPRPDDRELQAYLSSWLPEYAVPQYFQWLVRLPLNSNGKVIRALLPTPDWQALLSQGVEPGTQTELKLAETLSKMVLFPLAETFGGGKYSLEQPSTKIDTSKTFAQLGLDSLSAIDFLLHLGINSIDEGRLLRLTLQQLAQMIDQEET